MREDREKHQKSLISNFKNNPKRFYGYLRNMQQSRVLCATCELVTVLLQILIKRQLILCVHIFTKCLLVMMLRA